MVLNINVGPTETRILATGFLEALAALGHELNLEPSKRQRQLEWSGVHEKRSFVVHYE